MAYIVSIVKQLFYVSIISMLFVNLVPGEKYQKMIKIACGLLMVLIMIQPLLKLTNTEQVFQNIYQSILQNMNLGEFQQENIFSETDYKESMAADYENQIAGNIDSIVMNHGLYPAETKVQICTDEQSDQYGCITAISMVVSNSETDSMKDSRKTAATIEPVQIEQINVMNSGKDKNLEENQQLETVAMEIADFYQVDRALISVIYHQ